MNLVLPSSGYYYSNLKNSQYVVLFLSGDSPASEFYVPTFRNTLSGPSSQAGLLTPPMKMERSVSKRRHIKVRSRGITQKEEYNIQNAAKFGNQGSML
jgi:hypothetical protein